jgi:hypothetical protein
VDRAIHLDLEVLDGRRRLALRHEPERSAARCGAGPGRPSCATAAAPPRPAARDTMREAGWR